MHEERCAAASVIFIVYSHMEFLVFGEDVLELLVLGSASGVRALPMIQAAT